MIHLPETPLNTDWELIRLFDGAWSIRFRGVEQWILNPCHISRQDALGFQRMLNYYGLRPSRPSGPSGPESET